MSTSVFKEPLVKIKKVIIRDKIYFDEKDVENFNILDRVFLYRYGEDNFSTLEHLAYNSEETHPTKLALPSGALDKLDIKEIIDERVWEHLPYKIESSSSLRPEQEEAVINFIDKSKYVRSGILQAKCGWGKTYTGAEFIRVNQVKTIILVHTKMLFDQWYKELTAQLFNISIGRIGDGIFDPQDITVSIYKSASNNIEDIAEEFSMAIVDEAHLCPAKVFSSVLNSLWARVKIGMTATPKRKDGRHLVLPDYFTSFIYTGIDNNLTPTPRVKVINTDVPFPIYNPKRDWSKALTTLANNEPYVQRIAKEAIEHTSNGRCILILSDRIDMLKRLNKLIPNSSLLIGATKDVDREHILNNVGKGIDVILSTTLFDFGVSCHRLDTLFLTCPLSHKNLGKLEQRIGRLEREHEDKRTPLVVDFWLKGTFVYPQQLGRYKWYDSYRESPRKEIYDIHVTV